MAKYVTLISWTEQGVSSYADTVKRAEAGKELAARLGGRLTSVLWTLGPYDLVVMGEFPNDEAATAAMLALSAAGNVRTTTMRAFDSDEIAAIVAMAKG